MRIPSEVLIPKAQLRIGFINGATIMAPITTAGLSTRSPSVAMIVDVISNTKNDRLGKEDSTLSSCRSHG